MLSDPQAITVGSTPVSLPRVAVGNMQSTYRSADGSYELSVAHTANKRERSVIKIVTNKIGADPLNPAVSRNYSTNSYLVVDAPLNGVGFTDAELENIVLALTSTITTPGFIAKFLGKES